MVECSKCGKNYHTLRPNIIHTLATNLMTAESKGKQIAVLRTILSLNQEARRMIEPYWINPDINIVLTMFHEYRAKSNPLVRVSLHCSLEDFEDDNIKYMERFN